MQFPVPTFYSPLADDGEPVPGEVHGKHLIGARNRVEERVPFGGELAPGAEQAQVSL